MSGRFRPYTPIYTPMYTEEHECLWWNGISSGVYSAAKNIINYAEWSPQGIIWIQCATVDEIKHEIEETAARNTSRG